MSGQEMITTMYFLQNLDKGSIYGTWRESSGLEHVIDTSHWTVKQTNSVQRDLHEYTRDDSQTLYLNTPSNSYGYTVGYSRIRLGFSGENVAFYCEESSGYSSLDSAKASTAGESFVSETTANCNGQTWVRLDRISL